MKKTDPSVLLEHGLHLGHRSQKIHPLSRTYIYKIDQGTSIIDLFKTAPLLDAAKEYVLNLGKEGKTLLVIATKKQARDIVSQIAKENEVLYVTNKWVAGLLTNFSEISKNIKKMRTLRKERDEGAWSKFVKHERIKLEKQLNKIASIYEGIEKLEKMPDALFIIDIKQDSNSVIEATRQNIPTIAVVDTNCNPHLVDFPIPANDDAVSSITFLAQEIIGAYVEGRSKVKKEEKAN
jgi:small subunit ribosomal protein S2